MTEMGLLQSIIGDEPPVSPITLASRTTVSTLIATNLTKVSHGQNKKQTILIYPTVSPESIVVPIVSCIIGFPLLALLAICCLRRRAKMARERERRRNFDLQDHAMNLVRFTPIQRLSEHATRPYSLSSDPAREMFRSFPPSELDTVIEEHSSEPETLRV